MTHKVLFVRNSFGLFFSLILFIPCCAQPGWLHPSSFQGSGADGGVACAAIQADGRILVGGSFTTYGGVNSTGLVRVNTNGDHNNNLQVGTGFTNNFALRMHEIMLQPDEKVLLAGQYTAYNGVPCNGLIRLDPDGTNDLGSDPGAGPGGIDPFIYSALVQPDGKIMVGGGFSTFDGVARRGVARLTAQGSVDNTFTTGTTGVDGWVNALGYQSDGNIIIAGQFFDHNGVPRDKIARLDPVGSLDPTFDPGTGGSTGRIDDLIIQPDGKIIIAGTFGYFNGIQHRRITRLNTDGPVDDDFNPGKVQGAR